MELLRRLEEQAKKGDAQAVLRIREIAKFSQGIICRLPPKITKKPKKHSTPSNALALRLLHAARSIKDRPGNGGYTLAVKIKGLRPLDEESFPEWWKCAWGIATDDILRGDEISELINQVGATAPSVLARLEEKKKKAIEIYNNKMDSAFPGTTLEDFPNLKKKIRKQLGTALNEWYGYVRRKTRLAAQRVWFGNEN